MSSFVSGNASHDQWIRDDNGWFLGHFLPTNDARFSRDVEVKWSIIQCGRRNETGFAHNITAKTLCVLVSGHMRIWLRNFSDSTETKLFDLCQQGDYLLWDKRISHDWEAISDCTIITIRWPSTPKDQKPDCKT